MAEFAIYIEQCSEVEVSGFYRLEAETTQEAWLQASKAMKAWDEAYGSTTKIAFALPFAFAKYAVTSQPGGVLQTKEFSTLTSKIQKPAVA